MVRFYFSPFSIILLVLLIVAAIVMIPLLFLGIIGGALAKLGFGIFEIILLIAGMIIGSFINIPIARIRSDQNRGFIRVEHGKLMNGDYEVPFESKETEIALNLGGCIIPVFISVYLLILSIGYCDIANLFLRCLIGIAIVTIVVHAVSKPRANYGIVVSLFIPPLCGLICGLVLSYGIASTAPVIAYVSAVLGTLIGADILNLNKMSSLGESVSIGGAGTFDGIFLSGIIAAFLA